MSHSPTPEVVSLLQEGLGQLNGGDATIARDCLTRVCELGHVNASVWLARAMAHQRCHEPQAMLSALDQSIKLEAGNPRALLMKADHYYTVHDYRAAAIHYHQALNMSFPHNQVPADLQAPFQQAQQRLNTINESFGRYLSQQMNGPIEKAGAEGARVAQSLEILLGRAAMPQHKAAYPQAPKQYYFPGLEDKDFYDHHDFSWVADLEAATDDIEAELKGVMSQKQLFESYIQTEEDRPYFDFHGLNENDEWSVFYLWKNGKRVEENIARCPKTAAAMEQVPLVFTGRRSPNVMFSVLKPGARIPAHNGMINTRLICHLPIIVPEGCGFRVGPDTRAWERGKLWCFDDTVEHEAWNNHPSETRYILLFEVWKPELSVTEQSLVSDLLNSIDQFKV